jgi:molybdopterin-guanine dinucleotide biosynthesis protein A
MPAIDSVKVLILAGGHSSRMGTPKHLLEVAGVPLYARLCKILHEALPTTRIHHISLTKRSTKDDALCNALFELPSDDGAMQLKIIEDDASLDIGPAAGLLAAHEFDTTATWLVLACDYPFIQAATVRQLLENYEPTVTCFKNADGFSEPLLGLWSPNGLERLAQNVEIGRSGPSYTVKMLDGKLLHPNYAQWLRNVNTPPEWAVAKDLLQALPQK